MKINFFISLLREKINSKSKPRASGRGAKLFSNSTESLFINEFGEAKRSFKMKGNSEGGELHRPLRFKSHYV